MFDNWDEFRANYRKCYEKNETLENNRIFSTEDHYFILGVYHRRLFEIERSSSEFLTQKGNPKKYRKYELFVY